MRDDEVVSLVGVGPDRSRGILDHEHVLTDRVVVDHPSLRQPVQRIDHALAEGEIVGRAGQDSGDRELVAIRFRASGGCYGRHDSGRGDCGTHGDDRADRPPPRKLLWLGHGVFSSVLISVMWTWFDATLIRPARTGA